MAIATLFLHPLRIHVRRAGSSYPQLRRPQPTPKGIWPRGAGASSQASAILLNPCSALPGICIAVGAYVPHSVPGSSGSRRIRCCIPDDSCSSTCAALRPVSSSALSSPLSVLQASFSTHASACPHADFSLLGKMGDLGGVKGIFVAIPYAVWFYLAFEAGGMGAGGMQESFQGHPLNVGIFTLLIGGMLMLVTTFSPAQGRAS